MDEKTVYEKSKQQASDCYNWLRLNILTPENVTLSVMCVALFSKRKFLAEKIPGIYNAHFLAPIAAPLLSQPVGAFFARLRENRDYERNLQMGNERQLCQYMETSFRAGENALTQKNYYEAAKQYNLAREGCKQLSGQTHSELLTSQFQIVTYKLALCLFYMNRFKEALDLINSELLISKTSEKKDFLNLRMLIYFKLGLNDAALEDCKASRVLDTNQNDIYIFELFFKGEYPEVLKHVSYDGMTGDYPLRADEPIVSFERLQIFGEASLKSNDYLKAITFFDAAIRGLPPVITYIYEKILLVNGLSNSYAKLAENMAGNEVEVRYLEKTAENFSKDALRAKANLLKTNERDLFAEATKYLPNDPRRTMVENIINPRQIPVVVLRS